MVKGQVISGEFGKIIVRQKSDKDIELGELLVADTKGGKIILQAHDLVYGSQISQLNLELMSGLKLEENTELDFMDGKLRNYTLSLLNPLLYVHPKGTRLCKTLPHFFSEVREIKKEDLSFLTKPKNPLYFGKLRSGSNVLDVDIYLNGADVFSHHILIAGTTGRGKSVLVSNILWSTIDQDYCGILVLDPHDEYYGRNKPGLKDHLEKDKVVYYTSKNPPSGTLTLKINLKTLRPNHFNGVVNFSDPQKQALSAYFNAFGEKWIEAVILEKKLDNVDFHEGTLQVVKRRLLSILDLEFKDKLYCNGIFDLSSGESTVKDIAQHLEESKVVIVDTSQFSGPVEVLVGSLITTEIFRRYKRYKVKGTLMEKPVISVLLEEAPRVLGKEALERGSNIFETIAREGRKFKVGITAITQLPSLIPRQILANMNTKIILGIEMSLERQAIIESASQDLSSDSRNIASLDKGEAIITSNFARFATPIRVPFFDDIVKQQKSVTKDFSGIKLE